MDRSSKTDDLNVESCRLELSEKRADVRLAIRYWEALGNHKHGDVRDGRQLMDVYRIPALTSLEGAVALAKAARDLFDTSGELPKRMLFDEDLIRALFNYKLEATQANLTLLEWLLNSIRVE